MKTSTFRLACVLIVLITALPGATTFAAQTQMTTHQAVASCQAWRLDSELLLDHVVVAGYAAGEKQSPQSLHSIHRQALDFTELRSSPRRLDEYRWSANNDIGTQLVWRLSYGASDNDTATSANQPPLIGMQILRYRDTNTDAAIAIEAWTLDSHCNVQTRQRRVFENEVETGLLEIDGQTGRILERQLLNPPVPPNSSAHSTSAGAVRVGLVDSGVNYLLPQINRALARDTDDQIIGYDFWDMDNRPFDVHPAGSAFRYTHHGTRTASLIIREAPLARLVPYRYPRPDMARMQSLVEHADQHGVKIMALPLGGNKQDQWQAFADAAIAHPHLLFVASAGNNGRNIDEQPVYPAALEINNLLVVTSADDFARPAEGVNWGRNSVDYLVPAENIKVVDYTGADVPASGSSYAVPRVAALAARYLQANPEWQASDILNAIHRKFADGTSPRHVNRGFMADPRSAPENPAEPLLQVEYSEPILLEAGLSDEQKEKLAETKRIDVPVDVIALDNSWKDQHITDAIVGAAEILRQCNIHLVDMELQRIDAVDYLKDLQIGSSRTVMQALRRTGQHRRSTLVFARDTSMATPFDAEAFGRGNTRARPWLQDSVWLTNALANQPDDARIALAHELFHVLANNGAHTDDNTNLMAARTQGNNARLTAMQCAMARETAVKNGLGAEN